MPRGSTRTNKTESDPLIDRIERMRAKQKENANDDLLHGQGEFVMDDDNGPEDQLPADEITGTKDSKALSVKKPLPMWNENERAGPNVLMRSSLFTIAPKNSKRWVAVASKPREVACLGEYEISMVGEQLRQDDGDVFFAVLHLARLQAKRGGEVQFVASEFINELGWNRDGHTYKRLKQIFRRLASTLIIVKGKNVHKDEIREAGFTMLQYDFVREGAANDGGKWRVRIPESTINLFWVSHYSRMHWDLRRHLDSDLARFLHSLYSTFRGPLSFGVAQLQELSGSQQKRLSSFRQQLEDAHKELAKFGMLARWDWQDRKRNRLYIEPATISEQHAWANEQLELLSSDDGK